MLDTSKEFLIDKEKAELLTKLKSRFIENIHRHPNKNWSDIIRVIENDEGKLLSLFWMEETGGEPDVIEMDNSDVITFIDCAKETPIGRRSICYDDEALNARKKFKPENSAVNMADFMGIQLLSEKQYKQIQLIEPFDLKTSSWLLTPEAIRSLGGALFGDRRYDHVFIYHNGADSYYKVRGFRGMLQF